MVLGLIPDCDPAIARNVGNAAGRGAVRALLSGAARARDRRRRPQDREDRDRDRARVPGALRRARWAFPTPTTPRRRRTRPREVEAAARRAAAAGRAGPDRGERVTDDRAGGAPAARPAAARAAHVERVAVPHPHAEAVRGRERRRPRDHRAQRRHDPRGGRHRWCATTRTRSTLFAAAGADVDGERVRFPRGMCRSIVQATAPRSLHPARAQPRAQRADRRRRHRVRAELRLAVRARPRPRPPLRDARRLRELREARVPVAEPAPLGRHRVRAGRHAGEQAPPRHGVRAPALQRQAVHGLGHRRAAAPPTASSWPASRSAATSPTAR